MSGISPALLPRVQAAFRLLPSAVARYLRSGRPMQVVLDEGLSTLRDSDTVVLGRASCNGPAVVAHELMHLTDVRMNDEASLGTEMAATPGGRWYGAYLERRINRSLELYGKDSPFCQHYPDSFVALPPWAAMECFAAPVFFYEQNLWGRVPGLEPPTVAEAVRAALSCRAFVAAYHAALRKVANA